MWQIIIGFVLGLSCSIGLALLQGAKLSDERNNHRQMYDFLKEEIINEEFNFYKNILEEYEQRFKL